MTPVVVFDTNILISGTSWRGKPFECLELARHGVIEACTCEEILTEFRKVLKEKLSFSDHEILATIADLLTFHRIVTITGSLKGISPDPDDDKILECALEAHATHIISGDTHHLLPLQKYKSIEIVTPADFLLKFTRQTKS